MILHIDMDAFFASVEQLDRPELRGCALVVGGCSGRGVVAAASYEARRYGIHSAMPMFMARQRCPGLVIVPPRKARYQVLSRSVMAILMRYSPLVEQVSIDEAYLDAAGCERLYGDSADMAAAIKADIRETVKLTCSIGVAPLKFLAKIASDMGKPDGLFVIPPERVAAVIAELPVEKVPGVGRQAQARLRQLGIATLGDVAAMRPALLMARMGKFGRRLVDLANGRDDAAVIPHTPTKSISAEETLPVDTADAAQLRQFLLAQSQAVGRQLRRQGFRARTVTLKLKTGDFRLITRSLTLARPCQSSETLYRTAARLLEQQPLRQAVRLIGIAASSLVTDGTPRQLDLFPTEDHCEKRWETVERTVDRIADRFGRCAIHRGSLQPDDDQGSD